MKTIAHGWIIYRPDPGLVKQETYEIDRLTAAAPLNGYSVEIVDPDEIEILVNSDGAPALFREGKSLTPPDFAIPRLGSMTDYYALAVIRQLETMGVFCVNGADAIVIAQDKLHHLQAMAQEEIPIPRTLLVRFPVDLDMVEEALGLPVVVKTLVGTQGSGVFLAKDRDELDDVLQFVEANNPKAQLVLQKFLSESKGRDIRIVAIGGQIVGAMERIASKGFKSNYSQGGTTKEFVPGPKNRMQITDFMRRLDLDMVGVDILYDRDIGFRVCEINSSPGFEGLEQACDVDVSEMVYKYLDIHFKISDRTKERLLAEQE